MINKIPLLSIVIVNFNTKYDTYNCIHSILDNCVDFDYEIILIDNCSTDGSVKYLRQKFKDVKIIELSENTGFSYANNRGFEISKGNYVLFLNSDTLFKKETLLNIGAMLISEKHLVMAPKLLNKDLSTQKSLFNFPRYSKTFVRISGLYDTFVSTLNCSINSISVNAFDYDYASFAAIIFQRHIFEKVGMLDEKILFYHEDCDMGFKLKNHSLVITYIETIEIIHLGGNSTSKFSEFSFENDILSLYYIFSKNYKQRLGQPIRIVLKMALITRMLLVMLGMIKGISGFKAYHNSGLNKNFTKFSHVLFLNRILKKIN